MIERREMGKTKKRGRERREEGENSGAPHQCDTPAQYRALCARWLARAFPHRHRHRASLLRCVSFPSRFFAAFSGAVLCELSVVAVGSPPNCSGVFLFVFIFYDPRLENRTLRK